LSNITTTPFADIASKLADLAFGKTIILPSERKQVAFKPKVMARYAGRYQPRPGVVLEIAQDGGALYAQFGSNPRISLFPQSDSVFFGRDVDVQVDFQVSHGRVPSLIWRVNGDILNAPRIP
jgi:hypothetical protein